MEAVAGIPSRQRDRNTSCLAGNLPAPPKAACSSVLEWRTSRVYEPSTSHATCFERIPRRLGTQAPTSPRCPVRIAAPARAAPSARAGMGRRPGQSTRLTPGPSVALLLTALRVSSPGGLFLFPKKALSQSLPSSYSGKYLSGLGFDGVRSHLHHRRSLLPPPLSHAKPPNPGVIVPSPLLGLFAASLPQKPGELSEFLGCSSFTLHAGECCAT